MDQHGNNGAGRSDFPIAIIGAGFAGIGMAIQLRKAGIESFTMYERAGEVGGTWRDNTYPGCACDVPSHVYSFSFEQNPNWTRVFAGASEIQAYLVRLVEKWQLRPHLQLNTTIVAARFDDEQGRWHLTTSTGDVVTARVVISGVGGLVDPAYPKIPGLDGFTGTMFHTARWNHDYELAGKRVAVVGTGASAIQVVPSIAPLVERLLVFQRTPAWVMPKHDHFYRAGTQSFLARHPLLLSLSRYSKYLLSEMFGPMVFLDSKRLSAVGERISSRHLAASVRNKEVRAKLRPNFQFGCKRVLISDDYWPTFDRENVDLITDAISEIRGDKIVTADGKEYPVDAIVLATGFKLGLANAPFPVYGRGGRSLDEAWKTGAVAYKGMTVSGFPNWFILMGPNTGPGHTSVLVYTEAQIQYALQAIHELQSRRLKYVDVKQEVQDEYNRRIQSRMPYMTWGSGCQSWYLSPDGSNHSLFPGFASEYVLRARKFKPSEYEVVLG